jgi:membrane-bound metal-dependent hydrolase YbcI (DUF457 family)
MDIGTHALASLALSRAVFPRAPKLLWAWTIPAGVIADADRLSALAGPAAYLTWYRTYTHSLLASLTIAIVAATVYRFAVSPELRQRLSLWALFMAVLLVQWLHLAIDAMQWQGIELFWPLRGTRIAFDWLPSVDPWILTILLAIVLLPELFHLVSAEIGAKDTRPRGFVAAIVGLVLVAVYIGLRADLHSMAIAKLQNRIYVGESPRKVAAFSEFTSLVSWRGLVESESALHEFTVHVNSTRPSAIDPGINLFKPEPNPLLDAAEGTASAKRFLSIARFPKATVQKMEGGSEVQIRDLRYTAVDETSREPMVIVDFDAAGQMTTEDMVWAARETPR